MKLNNKIMMITGAGSGQGRAEALLAAKEGAVVVATDINSAQLESLSAELKGISDKNHQVITHDIANDDDWKMIMEKITSDYGRLDVLVNNAGIIGKVESYHNTDIDEFRKVMEINVWGTYIGMRHAVLLMKGQKSGSIINVSSIASMVGLGLSPYGASKGAIRTMTKSAAGDFAKYNVRVNAIFPGFIETPMIKDQLENEKVNQWYIDKTPMGRIGKIEDVAPAVIFLSSDDASFITGSEITIDGGVTAI